jgi:hypothetical protein
MKTLKFIMNCLDSEQGVKKISDKLSMHCINFVINSNIVILLFINQHFPIFHNHKSHVL